MVGNSFYICFCPRDDFILFEHINACFITADIRGQRLTFANGNQLGGEIFAA
jgi:hypothetical protein